MTFPRSPNLRGLPCPVPLGASGPGTHRVAGQERGQGGEKAPSPAPPVPLSCSALTRLPGPQQDGRYQGSSLLLAAWASVCPSVKGGCFQETFWEGLEEVLGLPEGPVWEPPASSSGISRDLPAPRLILEAKRPP